MSFERRFELPTHFEDDYDVVQADHCKSCIYNNVCEELSYCIMEEL